MARFSLILVAVLVMGGYAQAQFTPGPLPVVVNGPNGTPLVPRPGGSNAAPVDPKLVALRLERQAAIADSAATDAGGLRLGENRSIVFARAGALTWKSDQKAASAFFQRAVNELANSIGMAEAEAQGKVNRLQDENRISQQVRPQVLNTIAAYDPEMALEAMTRTRSTAVQRALAVDPSGKVTDTSGMNASLAKNEMALEQRLQMLAAEKNPEKAIKMLQDTIKKGVSGESLGLLKKLYAKDAESATSLASETLDKLVSANYSSEPGDMENFQIGFSFVQEAMRPVRPGAKELTLDDGKIRAIVQRLINFTITDTRMGSMRVNQMLPIAEKYSPGSVAALKKVQNNTLPAAARGMMDPDVRRMMSDPKVTPAEMMTAAKTMAPEMKTAMYQNAAAKMAQTGDLNGAMQTLNANFSGQALESAVAMANSNYANYLIQQGKYTEAEQMIDTLPAMQRRMAFMNLATQAYRKNPEENSSFALGVLGKVRSLLPDRPEDNNDLSQFMQLINAYATVAAMDQAFATYEPLIPQLNELADANAIVQGFSGNNFMVKNGEFSIVQGGFGSMGFNLDPGVFRTLAKADYDRTLKLMDMFTRREIRIMLKLQLAENGLQ